MRLWKLERRDCDEFSDMATEMIDDLISLSNYGDSCHDTNGPIRTTILLFSAKL